MGGKAGQGINLISKIISQTMTHQGYYTFNYRDYPSIIRGGHNFNVLSISDEKIMSCESMLDVIVGMDEKTLELHKGELKKDGSAIGPTEFVKFGRNLNLALAGYLIKVLGFDQKKLLEVIKSVFDNKVADTKDALAAAEAGYTVAKKKFDLKKLNNKVTIMSGSEAVAIGGINSNIDLYIGYPMTPSTNALHAFAARQFDNNYLTFQAENEIAVVNAALGASYTGARVMVGSSGGGYDLMGEGLSLQGMSEVPLVVYLASRKGPATGIPTYNAQEDLGIALKAGHGEFPRVVLTPGNPIEVVEKVNEAFYLSQKYNCLAIVLSDKHIAESEFSTSDKIRRPLKVKVTRKVPGENVVKVSSYEHDDAGVTTEDAEWAVKRGKQRLARYAEIKKEVKNLETYKIYGKKNSKNLIVTWGSPIGAVLDATKGMDVKILQILYAKPMSDDVRKELVKASKRILIEYNLTGMMGRLIREKTGIAIENRILKYDGRPFRSDELKLELVKYLGKGGKK